MNSTGRFSSESSSTPSLALVRLFASTILLAAAISGPGCQRFNLSSRQQLQTDWDNPAVGQMALRMYMRTQIPSQQAGQKQLLEQVGSRLAAAADRPAYDWHFELVDDAQPRIVVFPGGNVVVTEGVIAACSNEAEFAAAVAHKLGHLLAGHELQRPLPENRLTGRNPRASTDIHADAVGHDPQDEIEADSIALSLLARAGYEPQALVSFWQHADANPERAALTAEHGERRRHMAQLQESLAQAQQIYRANRQRQGLGIQIVRAESQQQLERTATLADESTLNEIQWTTSNDRRGPGGADPHGAAKPGDWNADLLDDGDWRLPVDGDIQQAGFEWDAVDDGE